MESSMKDNVQAFCCAFDIEYSSCGKRKPKKFDWTNSQQNKIVFIDGYLPNGLNNNKDKFGWLVESPAISKHYYENIFNNFDGYKKSYIKIFTCDESLIEKDPELFCFCLAGSNLPWTPEEDYGIHPKSKLISFLCSPKKFVQGHIKRHEIAEKFKGFVDFYGGIFGSNLVVGSNDDIHYVNRSLVGTPDIHYAHKKKTEAMNPYMFSVVVENFVGNTYFTEKITDCFANGVVPIYYGTKNILNYFDGNGIIFLDENFKIEDITIDLYYSKMESIKNNLEIIRKMPSADDILYDLICSL